MGLFSGIFYCIEWAQRTRVRIEHAVTDCEERRVFESFEPGLNFESFLEIHPLHTA